MGARGPAPKRSTQRRRRNKSEPVTRADAGGEHGYELPDDHSDLAQRFWDALRLSGQAQFYEPSDWAFAELQIAALDAFTRKPSAMMLAAIQSGMSSLLVTEGDRRRARLELTVPDDDVREDVPSLDEYRNRLATR